MPISRKNRKILWGKSGNRCAICKQPLIIDSTESDPEALVGDECHIISGAKEGPRYDENFEKSKIDELANLVLLCRVHHKQIDDQPETYTAIKLRDIKTKHERWVEEKLDKQVEIPPVKIKRIKSEIPQKLPQISSGKELLSLATGTHAGYHDYNDDLNDEEIELVGGFIQNVVDWGGIAEGFEPLEKIRAEKSITDEMKLLNERGFLVFAAIENQILEGGVGGPSTFCVLHLTVKRVSDPNIVPM